MQRLRAADEAHRRHAEAESFEPCLGGGDDFGMVGQAEIVVGAEIDHFAPADADPPALRAFDQPLALMRPSASILASAARNWARKASDISAPSSG